MSFDCYCIGSRLDRFQMLAILLFSFHWSLKRIFWLEWFFSFTSHRDFVGYYELDLECVLDFFQVQDLKSSFFVSSTISCLYPWFFLSWPPLSCDQVKITFRKSTGFIPALASLQFIDSLTAFSAITRMQLHLLFSWLVTVNNRQFHQNAEI